MRAVSRLNNKVAVKTNTEEVGWLLLAPGTSAGGAAPYLLLLISVFISSTSPDASRKVLLRRDVLVIINKSSQSSSGAPPVSIHLHPLLVSWIMSSNLVKKVKKSTKTVDSNQNVRLDF